MTVRQKNSALAGVAAAVFLLPCVLMAQDQEEWTPAQLTVVLPHEVGGGQDTATRALGNIWAEILGTQIVYENRPGGAGRNGHEYFLQQPADGTTVLSSNLASAAITYKQTAPDWDYEEEFQPMALISTDPGAIFTSPDSTFADLKSLIEKAKEEKLVFAVSEWLSADNVLIHQIMKQTGAQFEIIPYDLGTAVAAAVRAGDAAAGLAPLASVERTGMRALAVALSENPIPEKTDNAPAVDEALGTETLPVASFRVISVPKSLAEEYPERYQRLRETLEQAKDDPRFLEQASKVGVDPAFVTDMSPEELMDVTRRYWAAYDEYKELLIE